MNRTVSSFSIGTSIGSESESEISSDDSIHQVDLDSDDLDLRYSSDGESADEYGYAYDLEGNAPLAMNIRNIRHIL
jgi:hypothetical protein